MSKMYIFFYLEMALKNSDDPYVYAFKNISHIPTKTLIEIFNININKDPELLDGYFLTKTKYRKHKKYIDQNMGKLNFDVFEYCLRQYATDDYKRIRRLYKEDLME